MKKIKVKVKDECCLPKQAHPTEWFDLSIAEDVTLQLNDFKYLDLGICMEAPKGYEIIIVPRSSTFAKYGIIQTNGIGVIDHAYCGDNDWIKMPALATREVTLIKGTRIAQFKVVPVQKKYKIDRVFKMENSDRKGLGSTGD